jgi:hypothetical protein
MEKLLRAIGVSKAVAVVCLLGFNSVVHFDVLGQVRTEQQIRRAVLDTAIYYSKLVRETPGVYNKHWAIARFNKPLKIPLNSPYCSSFGVYCFTVNGVKMPGIDGRAYSWRSAKRMVWHRGFLALDRSLWPRLQLMDAVVMTWSHVEFVGRVEYGDYGVVNVAANAKAGGKIEGVWYPVYRDFNFISGIYNNFTPFYNAYLKEK